MAEVFPLDVTDSEYLEWFYGRPAVIQEMIRSHPPNKLYRHKETGQRLLIHSYSEDRTVSVIVSGKYNRVMFERNVFGTSIDQLEECDLPGPDEPVGVGITDPEELEMFIDLTRPTILRKRNESQ